MKFLQYHHPDRKELVRPMITRQDLNDLYPSKQDRAQLHKDVIEAMPLFFREIDQSLVYARRIFPLTAIILFVQLWTGWEFMGGIGFLIVVIVLLVSVIILIVGPSIFHYAYGPTRARLLESRGVCVHCGHGLQGIPTDPKGLTKCPECTSHWRLKSTNEASIED